MDEHTAHHMLVNDHKVDANKLHKFNLHGLSSTDLMDLINKHGKEVVDIIEDVLSKLHPSVQG